MKEIQPITIWYNGIMVVATLFNLIGQNDNLITSANFQYTLYTSDNICIANGSITMSGDNYTTYSTSTESNDYAYSWGATQLNIILV